MPVTFLKIGDKKFSDISEFVNFLKEVQSEGKDLWNIQLVPTVSNHRSFKQFVESITEYGFSIVEESGKLLLVSKQHGKDTVYFYIFFDDRNQIPLFLTDAKKTDELPDILFDYLRKSKDLSNIWISPIEMKEIKDDLIKQYDNLIITYFSAKRSPNARFSSHYRPNVERSIIYRGIDGKQVLDEMEFYYGVLPKILEMKIPNGLSFKIDNKGIITIREGDIASVFDIIERLVRHISPIKDAIGTSRYSITKVGKKQFERIIQTPWSLAFSNSFNDVAIPNICQDIEQEEWDFTLLEHSEIAAASPFSARIIDNMSGSLFDISVHGRGIHVYPVEKPDIGSYMRFFEFVLESVDSMAMVG
jgi:hypothetical protein